MKEIVIAVVVGVSAICCTSITMTERTNRAMAESRTYHTEILVTMDMNEYKTSGLSK